MEIVCYGARGSIPVSGEEYLRYGGDTTCLQIRSADGETIVIDAGTGIRRLGRRLVEDGVKRLSLLFTHAHWDHLLGLPFFAPLYRKDTVVELYGAAMAQTSVHDMITHTMRPPFFPVRVEDLSAELSFHGSCAETFEIGTVEVSPVPLSHPNGGLGYKLREGDKTFVFLTDNELDHVHEGGLSFEQYVEACSGADLLVHDAEYASEEALEKRTWGHSAYLRALDLALEAGVKSLGLFHHNHERSDDQVDDFVASCRSRIAEKGSSLECFAVAQGMTLPL